MKNATVQKGQGMQLWSDTMVNVKGKLLVNILDKCADNNPEGHDDAYKCICPHQVECHKIYLKAKGLE